MTEHAASTMRQEMRGAIEAAGFGTLGRALAYNAYPGDARSSQHPAAEVFVRGKTKSEARWDTCYTSGF